MRLLEIQIFNQHFFIPVINAEEEVFWMDIQNGLWEPETLKLLNSVVHNDSNVLDVGCSVGETTIFLAAIARQTVGIDPNPNSITCIKNIIGVNPRLAHRLKLIQGAISGKDQQIFFGNGSKDFSDIHFGFNKFDIFVDGITIETLSARLGVEFSFINMDIEGGEFSCLPSMHNYFKSFAPDLLLSLHPGFNVRSIFLKSNFFFLSKLLSRLRWNLLVLWSLRSYRYFFDVSEKKYVSRLVLLGPRFLSGKNGNQCQIFMSNEKQFD
jgi:FkbM family methyltransferase